MIEVHGLTKIFTDKKRGEVRAVDNVNFTCRPGQIYGLLGANGAGKTTTLRLLATLLKPSSGKIVVAGTDASANPARVRQSVGFLATSTALYARLTARETIVYFGRLNGLDDAVIQQRMANLVDLLEMGTFLDTRCDKLSTGMKQKVSIARTLIHEPAVIIFDEPTVGLDVIAARAIVAFIRDCRNRGRTVIYSTHVMSEVEKLCDVVGIIHNGRLLAEGPLPELKTKFGQNDTEDLFVKVVGGEAA
ncbi:MAG: ATP-binding cassette domain-containing protein [Nibricoccus sp.]